MFNPNDYNQTKTLIVVYKDEMLVNQLRKLVETKDDNDDNSVVGTTDNSINIVAWSEKVWLSQKKAGNINDKVLFLGDIKGTDKLTPVVDVKMNKYGVKFGWAGNQAVLFIEPKVLANQEEYNKFLSELVELPVPDVIKKGIETISDSSSEESVDKCETEETVEMDKNDTKENDDTSVETKKDKFAFLKKAKDVFEAKVDDVGEALKKAGSETKEKTNEMFRDRPLIKKQMLFYGIDHIYNDWLETYMNL